MSSPAPHWTAEQIAAHLKTLGSEKDRAGQARYGITVDTAYGISNDALRKLARAIGRDHARAAALWASGQRDARLLALFSDEPNKVTRAQAEAWAAELDSWEMVDHAADLFVDAGLTDELIPVFAADEREFVRRAAFSIMATAAVRLKTTPDAAIAAWLPLVETHAGDPRNFVKKAVNWALRQIGKRSPALHREALALAEKLAASPDRTRRWVGKDAVKELTAAKTLVRLARRAS